MSNPKTPLPRLERCGHCGAEPKVYSYQGPYNCWIDCPNCKVRGKMCRTKRETYETWNDDMRRLRALKEVQGV